MSTAAKFTITADQITDVAPVFFNAKRVPLFVGKPGMAKTAFVREAANALSRTVGAPVAVRELHLASVSEVDIRGYLVPVDGRAIFTKPEFWEAVENSPYGILFLDEFAQASHEVQKAVAPLILEGRIGEYRLPPGWSVMLASNGLDDNAGTNTLLSHVLNRVVRIEVTAPDVDVWASWAATMELPYELIAFAKLRPDVVFNAAIPNEPDTPYCTPRSLHAVGDLAKQWPGGLRDMVESKTGMAMITGAIGSAATVELSALVRTAINLPSYEDVVTNPEGTMVPSKPDQMYAMLMLVAVRAKLEHADQCLNYVMRFQPNYAVTGIVSMVRRDRMFAQSPRMLNWVGANKDLLKRFRKYITSAL